MLFRSLARSESERICTKQTQSNVLEETFKNSKDDYSAIVDFTKRENDEVLDSENWTFFFAVSKSLC